MTQTSAPEAIKTRRLPRSNPSFYVRHQPCKKFSIQLSYPLNTLHFYKPFFSSLPIMAPTKDQIAALLQQNPLHKHVQKDDPGSLLHFGGLEDLFTDNIHISIPGLGIDIHGSEALSASSAHPDVPPLTDIINTDHPVEALPPHVIGGGDDDWAVAILGSKATTHSGR